MKTRLQLALHPPPEPGRVDTSLRYTDILFGFVIRELFLRLQDWSQLTSGARWHLVVGTTLVLGSWIGFRRSLNRTTYEVKFFNLPFFRFLADQLMLILYFRIAVLTQIDGKTPPPTSAELASNTSRFVMAVFFLYLLWDVLGIWMAKAKEFDKLARTYKPRYPRLKGSEMTAEEQRTDWAGFSITAVTFVIYIVLWWKSDLLIPNGLFLISFTLLIAYRVAKETRTSWRSPR
jgi:hypothetical protein